MSQSYEPTAHFSAPGSPPSGATENQNEPRLDAQERLDQIRDQYPLATDKIWHKKSEPNSELCYAILNSHVNQSTDGPYPAFSVDGFTVTAGYDAKTKKQVEHRHRITRTAPDGSPIYSQFHIDCWKFCEEYVPDESWMTASEWKSLLKELAPVIEHDKRLAGVDRAQGLQRDAQLQRALEARTNPNKSMAEAVVAAMTAMGLTTPKPQESK